MKKIITLLVLALCLNTNAQIITTVAGKGTQGFTGDGAQATAAELYKPSGVAIDPAGNLYIVDYDNNVIRRVTSSGIISTVAGNHTSTGYNGDGIQATSAELSYPQGVTFDVAGNLYIADATNNLIRKVILSTGIISTFAGDTTGARTLANSGYSGDGGQATNAKLNNPTAVAFDAAGNLYITDEANVCIRKVNTAGMISTVAGTAGVFGFSGDGGAATAAELSASQGIALDGSGNLYIADYQNNRIRQVNTAGIISTIAGTGLPSYGGDGGQAISAKLYEPKGVTCDAMGNLYISDLANNVIRKINTAGIISTIAGNNSNGYYGDGGQATAAELYYPNSTCLDAAGNLYIADAYNNRIRKVTNAEASGIKQTIGINSQVSIYPNPNNGRFTIETNFITNQILQLYDVNGKMVLSQIINGKADIDANSLNEGVYYINISSSESVVNKRIVIIK